MTQKNAVIDRETIALIPTAVLLPLIWHQAQWQLLFIRRAEREGDQHSGQVAFPGGRLEPEDSSAQAGALRETQEEIGLEAQHVEILTELPAVRAGSRYTVAPFVGKVQWPQPLRLNADEVADVFSIPLSWLSARSHYQEVPLQTDRGQRQVIVYQPWQNHVLWGASARMTQHLIHAIGKERIRL